MVYTVVGHAAILCCVYWRSCHRAMSIRVSTAVSPLIGCMLSSTLIKASLALQEQQDKETAVAEKERLKLDLASAVEDVQRERDAARTNADAAVKKVRRRFVAEQVMSHGW